jgi:hypothetical protein
MLLGNIFSQCKIRRAIKLHVYKNQSGCCYGKSNCDIRAENDAYQEPPENVFFSLALARFRIAKIKEFLMPFSPGKYKLNVVSAKRSKQATACVFQHGNEIHLLPPFFFFLLNFVLFSFSPRCT